MVVQQRNPIRRGSIWGTSFAPHCSSPCLPPRASSPPGAPRLPNRQRLLRPPRA